MLDALTVMGSRVAVSRKPVDADLIRSARFGYPPLEYVAVTDDDPAVTVNR
jgi:hypothetical protein